MDMLLLGCMTLLFSWQSPCARLYTENYAGPRKEDASGVYAVFYGSVIAFLTLALNGFRFGARPSTWYLGLLNGGLLLLYTKALVNGSVSGPYNFLILSSLSGGLLVPMFCSTLFMGETLTALQIVAVVVMLFAFVVMNLQGLTFRGGKPKKAFFFWCALLCLTNGFYGQLMNFQQAFADGAERAEMIVITYATTAVVMLGVMLLSRGAGRSAQMRAAAGRESPNGETTGAGAAPGLAERFRMGRKALLFASLACIICTSATNLLVYLLHILPSTTVLFAINNGGVLLLSGLYALLVFHEKPTLSQICGMALAVVSIVLLNL